MSKLQATQVAYGFTQGFVSVPNAVIVSPVNPTSTDFASIGQLWINPNDNAAYINTSITEGLANWSDITGGSGVFTSLTVNPGPISLTGTTTINTVGNANTTIGNSAGSGNVTISPGGNLTLDGAVVAIGDDAVTISIGNTNSGTSVTIDTGSAGLEIDGSGDADFTIGPSLTTGNITIGGTAQTGTITLGQSSEANNVYIGNGVGNTTIEIGDGGADNDITICTAATGSSIITLGSTSPLSCVTSINGTVTSINGTAIGMLVGSSGLTIDGAGDADFTIGPSLTTGNITIGGTAQTGTITLGQSSEANNVYIGNGVGNTTIEIGDGGADNDITICTAATGSSIITLGSTSPLSCVTSINGTITSINGTAIGMLVGSSGLTIDGAGDADFTIGPSLTTGNITIGGTAQTGTITLGQSADAQSIILGGSGDVNLELADGDGNNIITMGIGTGSNIITLGSPTATSCVTSINGTAILLDAEGAVGVTPATNNSSTTSLTINDRVGVAQFTGQTTGTSSNLVLTISNTQVSVGSGILLTVYNLGSNNALMTLHRVNVGSGSMTVVLTNNGTQALNGDIYVTFWVIS